VNVDQRECLDAGKAGFEPKLPYSGSCIFSTRCGVQQTSCWL